MSRRLALVPDEEVEDLDDGERHPAIRIARDYVSSRLRDVGSMEASDPEGFRIACSAIASLAKSGRRFTADDVRASGVRGPSVGSAFTTAARAGLITVVGYEPSRIPSRRGGLNRVWQAP
jgi:hypothetical protein